MRRLLALPLLAALLLGSAACDSGDSKDAEIGARTRKACRDLLGTAGEKWVKENSERETGLMDVTDFNAAKKDFYDDARSWDPKSQPTPIFAGSELCRIVDRAQKPHTKTLSITYGVSSFPFDSPVVEGDVKSGREKLIPVNSDVKLVSRKHQGRAGDTIYYVYVKCRVSGTPAAHATAAPLEGTMTDTLTRNTGTEDHLRYLLHSAGVAAKEFGCRNHPVVPTELPS